MLTVGRPRHAKFTADRARKCDLLPLTIPDDVDGQRGVWLAGLEIGARDQCELALPAPRHRHAARRRSHVRYRQQFVIVFICDDELPVVAVGDLAERPRRRTDALTYLASGSVAEIDGY